MINHNGDSISLDHEPVDYEALGDITLEDAEFMPFFSFKDPNEILPKSLKMGEELNDYLHINMI